MPGLLFEKGKAEGGSDLLPKKSASEDKWMRLLPESFHRRAEPQFNALSQLEATRHFTRLSQKNFSVDTHFYPLGSCTMKYNPKAFDAISSWPSFSKIHPYQDPGTCQGVLQMLADTEKFLCEITGMDAFTLQPAAGAHGELCGILMVQAYHHSKKNHKKKKVLIPDSSHGTNPATAALCGYEVIQIHTNDKGRVDLGDLKNRLNEETAAFMITNPNTLGLFENDIQEICRLVHQVDGLVYYDGANLNALLGLCRPGDMGFDIVHVNLHKTFSVPHGGGGPGSGPVGVCKRLEPFLPSPRLKRVGDEWTVEHRNSGSIGRLRSFFGNVGAILRAYCYIRLLGREGLSRVSQNAIINANYLLAKLKHTFDLPYNGYCMHEFVLSARRQKEKGGRALDIAKRLLDYGIHAPTIYFPLIVEEALMIEPTETESKETLDRFVDVMKEISREIEEDPLKVRKAPYTMPISRIDEVLAARQPNLRWKKSPPRSS